MSRSAKQQAAESVLQSYADFTEGLGDKRKYPLTEFKAFVAAVRRYAELTRNDTVIHKKVVGVVHGLTEYLTVERKRVLDSVLAEADRLECLVFAGYDPYFEGDEPPGL